MFYLILLGHPSVGRRRAMVPSMVGACEMMRLSGGGGSVNIFFGLTNAIGIGCSSGEYAEIGVVRRSRVLRCGGGGGSGGGRGRRSSEDQ